MSYTWNDDERSVPNAIPHVGPQSTEDEVKNLGEILKEYYQEERDRLYNASPRTLEREWKPYHSEDDDWDDECSEIDTSECSEEEQNDDELNAYVEEKVMYKKFWYV